MAQQKNAVIVGGGAGRFGNRKAHLLDMIPAAARAAAGDIPGLKPADIAVLSSPRRWPGAISPHLTPHPSSFTGWA